ncbi:MAG: hypothetical protein WCO56_00400 [Verrucomicrobiota bacterium]
MSIRLPRAVEARRQSGFLTNELVVAMAILAAAMIPLGFAYYQDHQACRACYRRAIAMELVDGEMEVLLAGEWRAYVDGVHPYFIQAGALTNLGKGEFQLLRSNNFVRLEWRPLTSAQGGMVTREGFGRLIPVPGRGGTP